MKCFYCPQKDESVVPWDSLSPDDHSFLRDKYPDAGQGAVCDLCVRSARPSSFFGRLSLSTSSSAPQSLDSGLQLPSAPLVMSGAVTPLATESVEPGVVEPAASGAESSTAATGSATVSVGQKVRAKPSRMESLGAFLFFWQALFVHGKPIFSARQVTKNAKKIGIGLNPRQRISNTWCIPLDHCLVLPPVSSGTMYRWRDDCKSVLHTHPAHSEMQMGSLCAFIFFQQALFVHAEPIFSRKNVKKMQTNSGP